MFCVEAKLNYLINIIRKITKYTESQVGAGGPFAVANQKHLASTKLLFEEHLSQFRLQLQVEASAVCATYPNGQ